MDPLSVTVSVLGLIAAAGKVAFVLSQIKASMPDAPSSIEQTLLHIKELHACFAAVHKFIVGASPVTPALQRRLSMIEVDQLVATLTESVLTFSELEALVKPYRTCPQATMRTRIKWYWKEDAISRIMLRLDRHKSSLSLMLSIVQCESDREAEQFQQSLIILVQQLVESNVEIARRLKTLETTFETESILTTCFRNGNLVEKEELVEATTDQPTEIPPQTTSMIFENSSTGLPSIVFHSAFENDLKNSRVYKRSQPYECDVSFTSSAVRSHSWSVFSGLSLSQISSISVIALPVYSHEIPNKEWYGFAFFDQPDSQGTPKLAIDEDFREEADFWTPHATSDGRLSYFNGIQMEAGDQLDVEILMESRPPPKIIARNNMEDKNYVSNGNSVSEKEGERFILASIDPQSFNRDTSTNPVFQAIETNVSKIPPYIPSRVTFGPAGKMALYRFVVLGDSDVGKFELTIQYTLKLDPTYEKFEKVYRKQAVIDDRCCMLEILDQTNQDRYTALLLDKCIRDGEGFVLIFSITNRRSFKRIYRFYRQIQRVKEVSIYSPLAPIMLVGNNCDRGTEREVSTKEGYSLARKLGCKFVEASAMDHINVQKIFYDVVRQLRQERMLAAQFRWT